MDRTLVTFVRAVRAAGVDVSTAETLDAMRAVAGVGYEDRARLKTVLGLVLAKSFADKDIYARVFEQYFSAADQTPRQDADAATEAQPQPAATGDATVDKLIALAAEAEAADGRSDAVDFELMRAAQAVGVDEIRFQTQMSYFANRTLRHIGLDKLEARLLDLMMARTPEAQAEGDRLADVRKTLQRRARAVVGKRHELFGKTATDAFMADIAMERSLGTMTPGDLERMKVIVTRMAKRLAQRHARRRRIKEAGRLDIRRTLRANAGHDGVPFKLVSRYRLRDKPRIVAICDVSGSVSSHARFLLLFLYALHGAATDVRAFAFSNRLMDVGPALERLPFDAAMSNILKHAGGGGTDYGQAFADLYEEHWDCIDKRTTVLILGDGRSNRTNPRLDLFKEMTERAKRVVWMCTEPERRWGTGDSAIPQFEPFCTHLSHCATLADIERLIDDALAAYA
jgi:uncharacterized protein